MSLHPASNRFQALDLLRGFFIVVIIVDHFSRWPSIFSFLTGKALLWVTAAEGFVIISGLLVGFIRGYKAKIKDESLKSISFKLWRRALTLYLWAVLGSIIYTAALWYIPLIGGKPELDIEKGDWLTLIVSSVTLSYTFMWVYFLKLYAIFLAVAPFVIWLLRINKGWLALLVSFAILTLGWALENEVLQWQFLFNAAIVAGYYMPSIQNWWQNHSAIKRRSMTVAIVIATVATITISAIGIFMPQFAPQLQTLSLELFDKESMSLARILMAFLWFTGYLLVFIYFRKYIARWFGWLLLPIGTHSLTAYILHGAAIITLSYFTLPSENVITNSLLTALAILLVWVFVKIPGINKVIPR